MLDRAVAFMNDFIQREYEFFKIKYTERDDAIYETAKADLRTLFADDYRGFDTGPDYNRPRKFDEEWFKSGERRVAHNGIVPRTLFQIKHYDHPEIGPLFRAYTSFENKSDPDRRGYFANYFLALQNNELRIVTRYRKHDPRGRGIVMITDNGLMWAASYGMDIRELGTLVGVRKIEPPAWPEDRAEYDAE